MSIVFICASDFLHLASNDFANSHSCLYTSARATHFVSTKSYLLEMVLIYSSWVIPYFSLSTFSFSSRCFCLSLSKSSTAVFAADATSALNLSTSKVSVCCELVLLDNKLSASIQAYNLSCSSSRVSISSSFKGTGFLFAIIICVLVCTFSCPCHHRQNVTNHHLRQLTEQHAVEAPILQPLLQHQTYQ